MIPLQMWKSWKYFYRFNLNYMCFCRILKFYLCSNFHYYNRKKKPVMMCVELCSGQIQKTIGNVKKCSDPFELLLFH